ncbi:curli production assembly/transport component CsgF [Tellurirhabdus bombi]|uniref:curli production assembly/transport component CsgF n=1 Tax=Tellurirhabdus bombi TaxID=2907205 RepID=UPI001F411D44|nr:curli production assembly/transport component CsgF [Tellurirhabdus bombi]
MKKLLLLSVFMLAAAWSAQAQQLIYRPMNPFFGGSYLNYSTLLSSANAQDTFKDPTSTSGTNSALGRTTDPLANFSSSLQQQILSRISRNLLDSQFGEDGLQEGTFTFGDLQVNISNAAEGVVIRIVDGKGGETNITVPYY